jgi:hypothetical protein
MGEEDGILTKKQVNELLDLVSLEWQQLVAAMLKGKSLEKRGI